MSVVNFINNFRCSGFITAGKNICFVMWNGMPRLVVQEYYKPDSKPESGTNGDFK